MSYSVYLKISGKKYKLPVNPEEIKKTQKLSIEKYQVLKSGQVSVPNSQSCGHMSSAVSFLIRKYIHGIRQQSRSGSIYPSHHEAQRKKKPVQLIYSKRRDR